MFYKLHQMQSTGQRGFTLIELMVAVVVIGILAAIAMPNYRVWIQNTKTRTAAESIQTGLQKARIEAVKRNVRIQLNVDANSGWQITCVDAAQCPDLTAGLVESRLPSEGATGDVEVTFTGSTQITYNNLGAVTGAGFTQLDLTNSKLTSSDEKRDLRIEVGAGGISRLCDPKLSTSGTDPRKCS